MERSLANALLTMKHKGLTDADHIKISSFFEKNGAMMLYYHEMGPFSKSPEYLPIDTIHQVITGICKCFSLIDDMMISRIVAMVGGAGQWSPPLTFGAHH